MTNKTKDSIIEALGIWLKENGFTPAEFSKKFNFSASYLSNLMNGKYSFQNGTDKETIIDDKYFRMIADAISFNYDNKIIWEARQTPQFMQMISYLEDARTFGYTTIIIGETGSGKTFSSDIFVKSNPKDLFKVTVGSMDTIGDLLDKLGEALRIPLVGTKSRKLNAITQELKKIKMDGRTPTLIFDESEYMKQPTLCNMKEMYDHLNGKCGLVMIGTNQLIAKIERLKNKNKDGMPQFYRRIKYNIRELRPIDTRFEQFLTSVSDKNLVRFLQRECQNYGELHDVLLPAMREAQRLGEPLTENLVRKILNRPIAT